MNCAEFQEWLQRRLDGGEVSEADAEHHRASCAACASLHEAFCRLEVGLRMRTLPLPPAGLGDAIVGEVLARQRTARRLRFAVVAAALAAALVLAAYLGRQTPSPSPADNIARNNPEPLPMPVQTEPRLNDRVDEASSALASIISRTADETVKEGRLLLPDAVTPPTPDVAALAAPALDPATQPLYDAGQSVTTGLEPVATSARRAVTLFLRDMPPMAQ